MMFLLLLLNITFLLSDPFTNDDLETAQSGGYDVSYKYYQGVKSPRLSLQEFSSTSSGFSYYHTPSLGSSNVSSGGCGAADVSFPNGGRVGSSSSGLFGIVGIPSIGDLGSSGLFDDSFHQNEDNKGMEKAMGIVDWVYWYIWDSEYRKYVDGGGRMSHQEWEEWKKSQTPITPIDTPFFFVLLMLFVYALYKHCTSHANHSHSL